MLAEVGTSFQIRGNVEGRRRELPRMDGSHWRGLVTQHPCASRLLPSSDGLLSLRFINMRGSRFDGRLM
jgi:hypothetical protein